MLLFQAFRFPIFHLSFCNFSYRLEGACFAKPVGKDPVFAERPEIGKWVGGKASGTYSLKGSEYIIKLSSKDLTKIPASTFKTKKDAEIECTKILYELCKAKGKLVNEYRYHCEGSEVFLEVKVGKLQIQLDVQFRELIEKYQWLYHMGYRYVYRKEGKKTIKLEEEILKVDLKTNEMLYRE